LDTSTRQLAVGAELQSPGGVHFRVWAPERKDVRIVLEDGPGAPATISLQRETDDEGYFSGVATAAGHGTNYRYELDSDPMRYPDPASRFQPDGPHGPSQVIDGQSFKWTDDAWKGVSPVRQIIYEMHIGTFSREGTWKGAERELAELARAGITLIELMPVADFPGRFGWGYDGVDLFAPTWLYGTPDDMRSFVNEAHAQGIGVILDVVYNHLGPDGNYLRAFSPWYFSAEYKNDWGEGINFDGEHCAEVREFYLANVEYWIREFHLDGLRLDATQEIYDKSRVHILLDISRRGRSSAGKRAIVVLGGKEPQKNNNVRPPETRGY
jgi:maltooligosyltrehalose trehalohydrolase